MDSRLICLAHRRLPPTSSSKLLGGSHCSSADYLDVVDIPLVDCILAGLDGRSSSLDLLPEALRGRAKGSGCSIAIVNEMMLCCVKTHRED